MVWGGRPVPQVEKFVTAIRYTCPGDPEECVAKAAPEIPYVAINFATPVELDQNMEKAKIYSKLSLNFPHLKEVGFDDSWSFMKKLKTKEKERYLENLIDAVKLHNKYLQFGITIYEDEIANLKSDSVGFPAAARSKVDRVAFYLHHRENIKNYREYIFDLKVMFPNARIFGGVYHYDRIDYIGCTQGSLGKCSKADELSLFKEAMQLQVQMAKNSQLSGLEFYPGFVGNETSWKPWSNPKICKESRRQECIVNSKEMTKDLLRLMN
ncbi:hypothetical protein GmRootV118_45060 [Variovorax sp. V118]